MKNRLLGAILLVSGTTIGGGALALPVITGPAGFFPALILMSAIWLFMMMTAFYLIEVNLRLPGESNLISMVKKTLGRPGEIISWITYLLLLYSLLAAYLLGCAQILSETCSSYFINQVPTWSWLVLLFIVFGAFVYLGTKAVDYLNRVLMVGLIAGYIGLIVLGLPHINFSYLAHHQWSGLIAATSVVMTSFGYHIIIPTLSTYLEHDARSLKQAILWGSLIPFVTYLLWQFLAMGVIPVSGLSASAEKGEAATCALKQIVGSPYVSTFATLFAFFAIITSLIGVSLSLADFLADGLKIKKNPLGKGILMLLTFIPPLIFALFYPNGFILALEYAGIFVVILLALLPALMAWFERYKHKRGLVETSFHVPGGKGAIIATIVFSFVLLAVEVFA